MGSSTSKSRTSNKNVTKKTRKENDDTESNSSEDTVNNEHVRERRKENKDRIPRPPVVLKKELVPDNSIFDSIDIHAKKAPDHLKSSLEDLAAYLCEEAQDNLHKVRAFYIWITHNISFDVEGYFGNAEQSLCDAETVLQTGICISDGYCNVMFSFCGEAGIPCKTISGYAKGLGTTPDTEFSTDKDIDHSWNAVFLQNDWYLVDCMWGAGHIDENGKYLKNFTEFYFLTNPSEFVTSHFPFINKNIEESLKWQLLKSPISLFEFEKNVKLEENSFTFKLKPLSHLGGKIETKDSFDVIMKYSGKEKPEFTTALYMKQGAKYDEMKQQVYAYTLKKKLFVHVQPPVKGQYRLMIYGRKASRDTSNSFQKLTDYSVNYEPHSQTGVSSPYPKQQVQYGAASDYNEFGFKSDAKRKPIHTSNTGTLILSYRIDKGVEAITDLEYSDNTEDLSNYTVAYTTKEGILYIEVRLPLIGFYKLSVKAKRLAIHSAVVWNVIDSLIECTNVLNEKTEPFPKYYSKAILDSCQILEPLTRDLLSNSIQRFRVLAPGQQIVMVEDTKLMGKGDLFEGNIKCPKAGVKLVVYCSKNENHYLEGIYEFKII